MRSNSLGFLLLAVVIVFTVYGQLSIKWRLNQLPSSSHPINLDLPYLLSILLDPVIVSGFLSAFLASLAWLAVLRRFDFSFAYPFISLTLPISILLGSLLFQESVSLQKYIGIIIIFAGTVIAAKG